MALSPDVKASKNKTRDGSATLFVRVFCVERRPAVFVPTLRRRPVDLQRLLHFHAVTAAASAAAEHSSC